MLPVKRWKRITSMLNAIFTSSNASHPTAASSLPPSPCGADAAAAVLDLGDPADRPCGFVRAGNPLCRKVPRGFQGRGKLLYGRCVEGDVDFVAVMNIHVDRVDRHEEQQQRRIKRREKQRGRGRSGQRVDQSDAADPDRGVEDQPAEVVGVVAREACKVSGAPLRQFVVVFEDTDPAGR